MSALGTRLNGSLPACYGYVVFLRILPQADKFPNPSDCNTRSFPSLVSAFFRDLCEVCGLMPDLLQLGARALDHLLNRVSDIRLELAMSLALVSPRHLLRRLLPARCKNSDQIRDSGAQDGVKSDSSSRVRHRAPDFSADLRRGVCEQDPRLDVWGGFRHF